MRIVSVNVGMPRTVRDRGRDVTTGIFKEPVRGPAVLRTLNLDGDRQADLENHGGRWKAVYAYPAEHYEFWRKELPGKELAWGVFGENLTTEGLKENETNIGDRFRIGEAVVMASQPRIPCYKLGIRLGRDDMVKRFLNSGRSGIYFSVAEEGAVEAGDSIERVHEDESRVSVAEVQRAYREGADSAENIGVMRRAVNVPALPPGWKAHFLKELSAAGQDH
jgi:MOSC domain-containing protein YiiM